jgi:putative membrane protein
MLPSFHPHPDVWLVFVGALVAYSVAVGRHTRSTGEAVDRHRRRLFFGGVLTLWVGADWPIHDLAEGYLYLVHMTQHMLFTLVAAPLLIAGTPPWMLRVILAPRILRRTWAFLVKPLVAMILFNSVLLFIHWPAVVEASVTSETAHFLVHVLTVFSALVMWWPVMSPLPEMPALSAPAQMMYLFLMSLVPTIPASFLTFGRSLLYPVYGTFPRIWGIDALTDQLIAGLIMKIVGGFILWGVIATTFFQWYERERRGGMDESQWRDVEREISTELIR